MLLPKNHVFSLISALGLIGATLDARAAEFTCCNFTTGTCCGCIHGSCGGSYIGNADGCDEEVNCCNPTLGQCTSIARNCCENASGWNVVTSCLICASMQNEATQSSPEVAEPVAPSSPENDGDAKAPSPGTPRYAPWAALVVVALLLPALPLVIRRKK